MLLRFSLLLGDHSQTIDKGSSIGAIVVRHSVLEQLIQPILGKKSVWPAR